MHSNKCYKSPTLQPISQSPPAPKDITCNLHASKEIIKIIQKQETEEIVIWGDPPNYTTIFSKSFHM
jgi:hypothetical protein